ncbi:hypothetical protein IscW_ISCW015497 [Ixodes scapularis]|uniref:Secreted protein n=1 Tax=Ixodes scapularis TaxID=6945 RepID=B7QNC2_IXOSC|nr:hypothetical protein IscW_ISCW015497 [Ixodes scapularis]|eukprot:XP_002416427.1 hypothetical protein IscW_ISCW015497 [Ixodes scapularis]
MLTLTNLVFLSILVGKSLSSTPGNGYKSPSNYIVVVGEQNLNVTDPHEERIAVINAHFDAHAFEQNGES